MPFSLPKRPLVVAVSLLLAARCYPQGTAADLNAYYRFPASIGLEYESLTPLNAYLWGSPFAIYELALNVRIPLPPVPVLQPILRLGVAVFDSQSQTEPPLRWDHTDLSGALGLGYATRFTKYFEVGAEALAGLTESLFYNLVTDAGVTQPLGFPSLLFEAGGRITLNPLFNLTIEIHPGLRYQLSLGEMKDFDGFCMALGFTATFRFGFDPDAPQAEIRAIRFENASIPIAFAGLQSWYARNPIGSVTLRNTDSRPLADVEVSFLQKGYMDSPTPSGRIDAMSPGESRKVDLLALFNDAVFRTEGVTPLTGEVIVNYKVQGRAVEQRQSVSFDLYDKRALTWDDERKVSALVTPDDSALKNYGGFIRQACKTDVVPALGDAVQLGMEVFAALGEIGCLYQADSELPFTKVQGNPMAVDTVNLARETLKSGLGDCDDLTVLYDSMLESLAVETGFITVPGHIFAALNTKVPSRDYRKVHPDRGMTVDVDGELWVPVEITLIGKAGFMDAWAKGVEEWAQSAATPEQRTFTVTRKARELYRPVGLREADLGLQYGSKEAIAGAFRKDRDRLAERMVADSLAAARSSGKKEDWNRAGVVHAQFLQYSSAEDSFKRAIASDPDYASARVNLGNLLFLRGKYAEALDTYQEARDRIERTAHTDTGMMARLLVNMARTCYQMERYDDATDLLGKAAGLDAGVAGKFAYLAEPAAGANRAAEQRDPARDVIFIEE